MSEQARIPALVHGDALLAPMPGWFRSTIADLQPVGPGDILGQLDVLGRTILVTAPDIRGVAQLTLRASSEDIETPSKIRMSQRRAVAYGEVLVHVGEATTARAPRANNSATSADQRTEDGLVFRAPTAGRFYARPSPDKPLFVAAGNELSAGTVVCLLEVMKTFSRVAYTGAPARVRSVLVADGADVKAGDPLLELEAV